jgi:hypothetical protein
LYSPLLSVVPSFLYESISNPGTSTSGRELFFQSASGCLLVMRLILALLNHTLGACVLSSGFSNFFIGVFWYFNLRIKVKM